MGIFDLFRKKSDEELFQEAVQKQDFIQVVKLGEKLLEKDPENLSVLNPYVEALAKLGEKEKAVNTLLKLAEKKIEEEYYEVAIPILKKALKIDPLNLRAIELLVNAYRKKELYYDAFKTLLESLQRFKEAGIESEQIKNLLEDFIREQFHPLFYEKYADFLQEEGDRERALINYVLASNLFMNLKNYRGALRTLLKAEKIKKNENFDKQLIEVIAYLSKSDKDKENCEKLLQNILNSYEKDVDLATYTVETFKEANSLDFLEEVAKKLKTPIMKYALLSLIKFEQGEVEEAEEYLEKLRLVAPDAYEKVAVTVKTKYEDLANQVEIGFEKEKKEELPEPELILHSLEEAIDLSDIADEYIETINLDEKPEEITKEISILKSINKDGKTLTSEAEALMGLEKYDQAIETAKQALDTEEAFKATSIIAESLRKKGEHHKAINFLLEQIEKGNFSQKEEARLKALIGKIHDELGEKKKALIWYREANKTLHDEEIEDRIDQLSNE